MRSDRLARLHESHERDGHPSKPRRGADARGGREDDASHRIRATRGPTQRNRSTERVADPHGAVDSLRLGHREDGVGEVVQVRSIGQRSGVPVPRQVGNEDAMVPSKLGRDRAPILDRPTQPVNENDRRTAAPQTA